MKARTYSTAELVELVGVSYSTLRRWVQRGALQQPRKVSNGRDGVRLVWRGVDLRRARALARRSRAGLPVDVPRADA